MMDNSLPGINEKRGGGGLSNGPSFRRVSPNHHHHHLPHHHSPHHQVTLTIQKDDKGYGMKVSGDNPVYVQSVKEGGAAERAGLHSGDTIVMVNGVNVLHLTHTEVVELIKAAHQVVLTVQQHPVVPLRDRSASTNLMTSPSGGPPGGGGSPSVHRSSLHHSLQSSRDRITGPQPVDTEKKRQLGFQKAHTLKLMLEKEQRFVENLRSKLAKNKDPGIESGLLQDLQGAERLVQTLQHQLEQEGMDCGSPPPPAVPSRTAAAGGGGVVVPLPPRPGPASPPPPPLPPRAGIQHSLSNVERTSQSNSPQGATNHQRTKSSPDSMAVNQSLAEASRRLISSESMRELCGAGGGGLEEGEEGGGAGVGGGWTETDRGGGGGGGLTPPGTPPPPYLVGPPSQSPEHTYCLIPEDEEPTPTFPLPVSPGGGEPAAAGVELSPVKNSGGGGFVIHNALQVQQQIISMEDEDMSDQEMTQTEDHGPFKSLSKLWTHQAHLAVFLNYVISNSDPSSLLFYLVTDLYKEGSAKEMKKWAYEIHSSFLVPGAPLRLNNVDENVAREIDEVLLNESHKEEILRKVFWKARQKAKEELNEQLTDFQGKRSAGLGTLFGPRDTELDEAIHDKTKELRIIESILIPKLEPYLEDIERGRVDDRRFSTGAALGTVMGKVFGLRGPHFNSLLERCLTYVSKDKSLKTRLIGKTRKLTTKGHHLIAHQYYTVTYCNHCQLIIWGIGPQGYQCTNCGLNIHRHCTSDLEESCPGPMLKKDKANNDPISKFMERIRREDTRRKPSHLQERTKRLLDEESNSFGDNDSGDKSSSGDRGSSSNDKSGGVAGGGGSGGGGRRPEPVREGSEETGGGGGAGGGGSRRPLDHDPPDPPPPGSTPHHSDTSHLVPQHVTKKKGQGVIRSESVKEKMQKSKQRDRRKTSDPNLSKTNKEAEVDATPLSSNSYSNSSSNSSLSTRSLESPSNSTEGVAGGGGGGGGPQQPWDSDIESEPVPQEWSSTIPEELRESMTEDERKRQEIINELFYTEKSHVRGLKVLERVFYRPLRERDILSPEQLHLLFANLEEMVAIHSAFNSSMKALRSESPVIGDVGQLLLNMFDGPGGDSFQLAAAKFCAHQQESLDLLKEKRKKDQKFHNFLTEAEMNSVCRRLQLKDILPTGWQRLTKYPLLLENLMKYSKGCDSEELSRLQRALDRSKEVLNYVDSAIKEAENQSRLSEIQRRLDTGPFDKVIDYPIVSEFRNLDLTRHRLLHEGPLNLRLQKQKLIDLHVLLLEDAIVLLQKQDEKYVLRFYSQALSPIIKVSTVLVRTNAVDNKSLYLVNTSQNALMYDFVAHSYADKRRWFKHLSDAAEAYKAKEGRNKRGGGGGGGTVVLGTAGTGPPGDQSSTEEQNDGIDKSKDLEDGGSGGGDTDLAGSPPAPPPASTSAGAASSGPPQPPVGGGSSPPQPPGGTPLSASSQSSPRTDVGGTGSVGLRGEEVLATYSEEGALVEPSEVLISQRDIHLAQPVLTPLEKLRRKDEEVRQALYEKQVLVADMLNVPREEFDAIADLAGEPTGRDKDPSELILAAVNQASALSRIVNEALRVGEEEVVGTSIGPGRPPSISATKIYAIVTQLNSHLSSLLNVMNERDEERERLRKELQKSREQLHSMHEKHQQNGFLDRGSSQIETPNPPPQPEVKAAETAEVLYPAVQMSEKDEVAGMSEETPVTTAADVDVKPGTASSTHSDGDNPSSSPGAAEETGPPPGGCEPLPDPPPPQV